MKQILINLREMGFLRNLLHGTAALFTLLMPFATGPSYSDSWNLFFSGILPATAPIIVIVIGLDTMMSSIWRSDSDDPERILHLTRVIRAHQFFGGILLFAWLAVFLPILL